jgi:hypothetical protein
MYEGRLEIYRSRPKRRNLTHCIDDGDDDDVDDEWEY